jgi:hypothetical protein
LALSVPGNILALSVPGDILVLSAPGEGFFCTNNEISPF